MLSYRVSFVPINFLKGVLFNHALHGILVNLINVYLIASNIVITVFAEIASNYYCTNNMSNDAIIKRAER